METFLMSIDQQFQQAVVDSKNLGERPSNETLLQLYSLYKQSTEGDVNVDPPGNPFDFVSKAKFDAWEKLRGMSKEDAQKEYVALVNKLKSWSSTGDEIVLLYQFISVWVSR